MDIYLIIQIIIGIAALYGLIVSSYNLSTNRRKSQYRVKVTLKRSYLITESPLSGDRNSEDTLVLKAQNIGHRPVTLNSMGFKVSRFKGGFIIINPRSNVQFPFELKEGKDCIVWSEENYIKERLRESGLSGDIKLTGLFVDAISKE